MTKASGARAMRRHARKGALAKLKEKTGRNVDSPEVRRLIREKIEERLKPDPRKS